jgi:hypothetical protein
MKRLVALVMLCPAFAWAQASTDWPKLPVEFPYYIKIRCNDQQCDDPQFESFSAARTNKFVYVLVSEWEVDGVMTGGPQLAFKNPAPCVSEAQRRLRIKEWRGPKQQYVCMHIETLDDEEQRQRERNWERAEQYRRSLEK